MTIEARIKSIEDIQKLSKELAYYLVHAQKKDLPIIVVWGSEQIMKTREK